MRLYCIVTQSMSSIHPTSMKWEFNYSYASRTYKLDEIDGVNEGMT